MRCRRDEIGDMKKLIHKRRIGYASKNAADKLRRTGILNTRMQYSKPHPKRNSKLNMHSKYI